MSIYGSAYDKGGVTKEYVDRPVKHEYAQANKHEHSLNVRA